MNISRRKFNKSLAAGALVAPLSSSVSQFFNSREIDAPLNIHIFSKHLQFLNWKEASEAARDIGFKGLDLTVRPKGHILPENVSRDLPRAIKVVKDTGLRCDMITTAIADATSKTDLDIISTASAQGVKYYRSDWFKYKEDRSLEASLDHYKEKVRELSEVNKKHNIIGCYQNHSGTRVGASVWEVRKILESCDPDFFGTQYDIRHAVAEGGRSWPNGVKLLRNQIKTIVLKDFKWGKVEGKWKIVNVPIGEGMVDFDGYFKILKKYGLNPPTSLHVEYPIGGAEKGKKEITVPHQVVYDAMKKDLTTLQELWKKA